ncbi:MAG: putative intracellular septation protein A [Alphaproteobacteria bacterium MarineAlpha5_Bin11]|nr:MAG: putative intracellular septation protein A [Alphaproteobacteria bacterium MarineAlpha5_Bin11]PPR51229.1 MAG: putative intracellular septation protein A [Alphaproteobacteria bacterium MarineAlpha5_Bin10]|tara:strand:+ start:346 stop:888 length:543 start_codon:yes stop_codon:yes gene_type:complete
MKPIIKFFVDAGPLVVFFIFYKMTGELLEAIIPLIIATAIAVLISYIVEKKIPVMPTIGGLIILIFGGLTYYFENKIFFYMKPTIINLLFAFTLILGNYFNKPLLKYLMGSAIDIQLEGWFALSRRWSTFFLFLAILNEIIWRYFSEETWVNFKVFGIITLTFIFSLTIFPIIKKYQNKE